EPGRTKTSLSSRSSRSAFNRDRQIPSHIRSSDRQSHRCDREPIVRLASFGQCGCRRFSPMARRSAMRQGGHHDDDLSTAAGDTRRVTRRKTLLLIIFVALFVWIERAPAPIVEEEKPTPVPAPQQSEAPKRKHAARSTTGEQSPS